jgi:hypothetical protein
MLLASAVCTVHAFLCALSVMDLSVILFIAHALFRVSMVLNGQFAGVDTISMADCFNSTGVTEFLPPLPPEARFISAAWPLPMGRTLPHTFPVPLPLSPVASVANSDTPSNPKGSAFLAFCFGYGASLGGPLCDTSKT